MNTDSAAKYFTLTEEMLQLQHEASTFMKNGWFEFLCIRNKANDSDAICADIHIPQRTFHATQTLVAENNDKFPHFALQQGNASNVEDTTAWFQVSYASQPNIQAAKSHFVKALEKLVAIHNIRIQLEQARQDYVSTTKS